MPANVVQPAPTLSNNELISIMCDPTRWNILRCLKGTKSAKQVAEELDMKPALVLYHLKILLNAGLVDEFSHPDYARRFVYSRRALQGHVEMQERGLLAEVTFYERA